ncbi:MAG: molybdenum cofactor biosynthesis protein MoaE [Gemmatimonadales bacterium]
MTKSEIDSTRIIAEVSESGNGATTVFIGTVRSVNDGREVQSIEYSAYEPMAEKEILSILREASVNYGVKNIVAEHRLGEIKIGEASVVIVASDPHRAPALDALRYVIEQLKKRVPIWKLEHYADGERSWVSAAEGQPA